MLLESIVDEKPYARASSVLTERSMESTSGFRPLNSMKQKNKKK